MVYQDAEIVNIHVNLDSLTSYSGWGIAADDSAAGFLPGWPSYLLVIEDVSQREKPICVLIIRSLVLVLCGDRERQVGPVQRQVAFLVLCGARHN